MPPAPSFNKSQVSTSGQRGPVGTALAACMAIDVLSLVDPAVGAVADLKAATATVAAIVALDADDLLTAGKTKLAAHTGRNLTFTTAGATASDAPANVVIVGKLNGVAVTETLALSQTAATATGVKCYDEITSITYPAADGTGATIAIGIGDKFAFPTKVKVRGAAMGILKELEDNAEATAGTLVLPATCDPNGNYTANSAPDGALDFTVYYEREPPTL
jgi:hypothetical protein